MNFKKTTTIALSAAVILSIASITGFQLTEITAEETEDKGYKFAEDVTITGLFNFQDGVELHQFQVFDQKQGFQARDTFVLELQKIVGETPYLHKAADFSYKYRNSPGNQQTDYEFDTTIIISQGGEQKRVFEYSGCFVSDYTVETLFDKEEGWMGKGFAVVDQFEIQCTSYKPLNPVYEEMHNHVEKANGKSSVEYQKEQRHLYGN
jgi:hypothetical protein